ncbi:chemotaxis protein CheW [Chroococcus sp. FPU101]|uniref:chemotaxis protein CheW n=1 Tax=Chroococcus sp. FPU101 TaxID=1974212 RepID=UPI001A8E3627|nr:chemotaxis protein CheW [Chroococcus sp. FPU101]GFE69190.1 CheW protein [Chroococcus sp. FPU101]
MNPEYFSFQLADALRIALPLPHVEKIIQIPQQQICPLPGMASYWAGITNYQGSLLWILDSEQFFDLTPTPSIKKSSWTLIVITLQTLEMRRRIALSAKALNGILSLDLDNSSFFPLSPQFKNLFTTSIILEEEIILVLDTDSFFSSLSTSNFGLINV